MVTGYLLANGWTDVHNVSGGMIAWEFHELPVRERPDRPDRSSTSPADAGHLRAPRPAPGWGRPPAGATPGRRLRPATCGAPRPATCGATAARPPR